MLLLRCFAPSVKPSIHLVMPVAFLYNHKLGEGDTCLDDLVSERNFRMASQCYQSYLKERDADDSRGLLADAFVGITAADVQANDVPEEFPQRFEHVNAVLTVVHEARLPALEEKEPSDLVAIEWGDAKRRVLESLWDCAVLQWRAVKGKGSKRSKASQKRAGLAQGILEREIADGIGATTVGVVCAAAVTSSM